METKKSGRPVVYEEKLDKRAFKLSLAGFTNVEIAEALGIAECTLYDWQNIYPSFSEALKKGKSDADADIVDSLYNRARGYKTTETVVHVIDGEIVKTEIPKNYAPDPVSMIFWLRNRRPKNFRNNPEKELQDTDTSVTINILNPADK